LVSYELLHLGDLKLRDLVNLWFTN